MVVAAAVVVFAAVVVIAVGRVEVWRRMTTMMPKTPMNYVAGSMGQRNSPTTPFHDLVRNNS